jgi:hypothetical protein
MESIFITQFNHYFSINMFLLKKLSFAFLLIGLLSCDKNEPVPDPVADFTVTVNGQAPTATLTIVNKSTNATNYAWTLGAGASVSSSTEKEPANVTVDKAGNLSITLVASNGSVSNSKTVQVNVSGNSAIVSFNDVEFSMTAGSATYGRYFSFETNKIYKDSEVDATTGSKIHLAFGNNVSSYYFESATYSAFNVPNATVTKVTNYLSPNPISNSDFDAMAHDGKLSGLTINSTNDAFGPSVIPHIVLFQLASGRKGAIKTKMINSARILVDIKIQKY